MEKGRRARAERQGYLQPLVIHGLVQSLVVLLLPLLHHVVLLQLHGAPHHHLGSLDLVLHNPTHSPLLPTYHHHCVYLATFDEPIVSVTSQSENAAAAAAVAALTRAVCNPTVI